MILVSGATGFIGQRLCTHLAQVAEPYAALSRNRSDLPNARVAELSDFAGLVQACLGVKSVIHCAGYAHAFTATADEEAKRHWEVNFEGTRNLVEAAGSAGVKKFVFLSSVKAMAEPGNQCVDEDHPGSPCTDYGKSKRAAEDAVLSAGARYGMHVVILRLAMVYGAGGRGNLERMGRLVRRNLFPPLPETGNRRSLVHVNDVVDAIGLALKSPQANGRSYIVASAEVPSGRQLFNALREAYGMAPVTWQVPLWSLKFAAAAGDLLSRLAGRRLPMNSETLERLIGSACYCPARIEHELGWRTKVGLADGLKEMLGK